MNSNKLDSESSMMVHMAANSPIGMWSPISSNSISVQSPSAMSGVSSNQMDVALDLSAPPTPESPSVIGSPQSVKKKVKGQGTAGKSVEEELCLICGDRASGYHYNALSCEGCKGFFRRSITRGATYKCKEGGKCEMDMWMRRRCQFCRLRRCREVGMKEECLLSEQQCKARDARRKKRQPSSNKVQQQQQQQQNDTSSQQGSPDSVNPQSPHALSTSLPANLLELLPPDDRQIIENLVVYQDQFELPSSEDIKRISNVRISDLGRPKDVSEGIYKHMAEMTILVTQLVVEFAKKLMGFSLINREDQITLLKGSACEVMMLRTARRYDVNTDTVVFANGLPFSRDSMRFAGLKGYVDSMFTFCRGMGVMGVDNAEYALLTALCIFQEREGLVDPGQIAKLQEVYINALQSYENVRRPKGCNYFAKLLMKLTELRQLSVEHSDVLFSLKIEKGSLPPLLSEYFSLVDMVE